MRLNNFGTRKNLRPGTCKIRVLIGEVNDKRGRTFRPASK
ncbi:hypothetical protein METP1_02940 [Methanosarcinales archaeon]|nr:hypothetical protein METP1_02940 [Methanosarcinales archaeon]